MGTEDSPRSLDGQNVSQTFDTSPPPPHKAFDSSHWPVPQDTHAWSSAPSFEMSSLRAAFHPQGSEGMHKIWVHQSQNPSEVLSSQTPEVSNVYSAGLNPSSPQSELSSFTSKGTQISLQSNMTNQADSASPPPNETCVSSSPTNSRPVSPSVAANPSSSRAPCSKILKGQHLSGEHAVYDVDMQLLGDAPQQLEVFPISVYGWDPALVAGRQIAVNRRYICYCLRPGSIRVLSRNVPLRSLFQGHSQRVTDMAFFAENVHLLSSASSDGRVLVWKILEAADADGKMQLLEQVVLAIQFAGEWKDAHPRVCWHPGSQDYLVTCINKYVMRIDLNEVWMTASHSAFTAENFLTCHIADPINGVQCIGMHDGEVTDLSVSLRDTLCIASASKDGTIRIWGEKKTLPLAVFIPHGGQPVGSVAFITAPSQPEQTVLLTGGAINHNLKLWVPATARGSLNPSMWHCIQTLELKSSTEGNVEQAFLNQVCVVPQAGLILLGNAKKNALYSVHVDFGCNAATTRFDYLVEFCMAMPILSLTAMAESVVNGKGIVQVFCVQTQVIQQYFLNVSLCIPPQEEDALLLKESAVSSVVNLSRSSPYSTTEAGNSSLKNKLRDISVEEMSKLNGGNASIASDHNLVPDNGSGFGSWVEVPNWVAASLKKTSRAGPSFSSKDVTDLAPKDVTSSTTRAMSPLGPVLRPPSPIPNTLSGVDRSLDIQPDFSSVSTSMPISLDPVTQSSQNIDKSRLRSVDQIKAQNDARCLGVPSKPESSFSSNQPRLITPSELMAMACFEAAAVVADKLNKASGPEDATSSLNTSKVKTDTKIALESSQHQLTMRSSAAEERHEVVVGVEIEPLEAVDPKGPHGSRNGTLEQRGISFEPQGNKQSFQLEESKIQKTLNSELISEQKGEECLRIIPVSVSSAPCNFNVNSRRKRSKNRACIAETSASTVSSAVSTDTPAISQDKTQVVVEGKDESTYLSANHLEELTAQVLALQETFDSLTTMQKDLQKHVSLAIGMPMARESKRMESVLERSLEKCFKDQTAALWNWIEEENKMREEFQQESTRQFTTLISNFTDKEVPSTFDQMFKKEVPSIGPAIAHFASPNIEYIISTAVRDNFQNLCDKSVTQLEKSVLARLDTTTSWHLQNHFKTSGRHSLQGDLCSFFENLVLSKFESSCGSMLEHADATLNERLAVYDAYAEEQLASSCFALASNVKDAITSALFTITSLKGELVEGQKRMVSVAENASASTTTFTLSSRQNSGVMQGKVVPLHRSDTLVDTSVELSRLLREGQLEEAFTRALSLNNVAVVFWLCSQVDPKVMFAIVPPPLSQRVLLLLVQQLGCDLMKDSKQKLIWIQEATLALNPHDPILAPHMRFFLEQLYENLRRQMALFSSNTGMASQARLVMHLVNSLISTCK